MRLPVASGFVALAVAATVAVGVVARRSPAHDDEATRLPADAARFGFEVRGRAGDVSVLEATKPFRIALGNGPVHGERPSAGDFARTSAVVTRELGRYPATFTRAVRLAGVVLTASLAEGHTPIPSLPNVGGLLLLDVGGAEQDLARALHHEVFHFADLADDGRLAPDPTWEALNPSGARYGVGGRALRSRAAARPSPDLPGFLSGYAESGPEEDKAETFAFAVTRPALVRERALRDAAVAAKVREIVRRVGALDEGTPAALGIADLAPAP